MKTLLGQLPGLLLSAAIVLVVFAGVVRSQSPLDNFATDACGDCGGPCTTALPSNTELCSKHELTCFGGDCSDFCVCKLMFGEKVLGGHFELAFCGCDE